MNSQPTANRRLAVNVDMSIEQGRVEQKAYEVWQSSGNPNQDQNWKQAEFEVSREPFLPRAVAVITVLPTNEQANIPQDTRGCSQLLPESPNGNGNGSGLTHKEEKVLFDRQWSQEKNVRRMENVQNFTGFLHGSFILNGVGHPNKKK